MNRRIIPLLIVILIVVLPFVSPPHVSANSPVADSQYDRLYTNSASLTVQGTVSLSINTEIIVGVGITDAGGYDTCGDSYGFPGSPTDSLSSTFSQLGCYEQASSSGAPFSTLAYFYANTTTAGIENVTFAPCCRGQYLEIYLTFWAIQGLSPHSDWTVTSGGHFSTPGLISYWTPKGVAANNLFIGQNLAYNGNNIISAESGWTGPSSSVAFKNYWAAVAVPTVATTYSGSVTWNNSYTNALAIGVYIPVNYFVSTVTQTDTLINSESPSGFGAWGIAAILNLITGFGFVAFMPLVNDKSAYLFGLLFFTGLTLGGLWGTFVNHTVWIDPVAFAVCDAVVILSRRL